MAQSIYWLFTDTRTPTPLLDIKFLFFVVTHIHLAHLLVSTDEILM